MAIADSPHGLLLRHFDDWARPKHRSADLDLLDELLRLRSSYDDLEPTYWPSGSVEHLLLERWPSKGAVEVPDPETLAESLDAFFRFLRNTGRMSAKSAEPKALAKEARRSVQRMPEAADDPARWSPTKVLMEYGRSIGLDVDAAPDIETLQQRLDQVQEAWNALPLEERRRLMPGPEHAPPEQADGEDLTGSELAMQRFGVDDKIIALLLTFADDLPTGTLPPDSVVAPIFERSPFMRKMLGLSHWVGDGRQVTATRVLRPALAHEVHDLLDLGAWTRSQLNREYPDESLPGVAAVGLDTWIEREATRPWRSAADCQALHRLWVGAAGCGLIEVGSSVARATEPPSPSDLETWVSLGVRGGVAVMDEILARPYRATPLVFALMSSYVRGRGLVTWEEIVDFQTVWWHTATDNERYRADPWFRQQDRAGVVASLGLMADTGLYVESEEGVVLTEAGDVFVTSWLTYMEG